MEENVDSNWRRTGKTTGIPPRTALDPSSTAPLLNQSFSSPDASFQLMTVAPKRRMSTLGPEGSVAVTVESVMLTVAWGRLVGVAERAEGFFERSTMV